MNVLIHIGFHKTGTSLLQKKIFSDADLGFELWDRRLVHNKIVGVYPYDGLADSTIEMYRNAANNANSHGKVFVLSHERLSGYPASGGFDSRVVAERIHSIFPEGKILIVIRPQCQDSCRSQ